MKSIALIVALGSLVGCSYFQKEQQNTSGPASQAIPKLTVEVEGVSAQIADNIRAHMTLSRKRCNIPAAYLRALKKTSRKEIAAALAAFGYYEATFEINVDTADSCPVVTAVVSDLGRETLLSAVKIEIRGVANNDSAFMSVVSGIQLAPGSPLKHSAYEKAKQTLTSIAAERGYFDAKFLETRLEVAPAKAQASASIIFDSGSRYLLGPVSIEQEPDLVSEELVRRYLPQHENAAYSAEAINNLNNALSQSNYFSNVDIRPEFNARADNVVPVSITLSPRARHSFSAAAGLSTDEGFRGRLKYLNRRLNRAGHRGVLDGRASSIAQSGSMEYLIPRKNPRAEWLSLQAAVRRENVDSFDTVETQGSISETKLRPFGWLETRYIRITNQNFDIASQSEQSLFFIPGLRWTRTTADDELYPTKGAKYSFEIRGAAESLLSDTSYFRATAAANWIRRLPWGSRLHLRTSLGGTWVNDFFELPPSERFFTGGDTTLRGYEFEELGPEDDAGEVIGGTYLGIASLEYEHPVTDTWSGAAFVDAGNAFGGEGSSTGVKLGIGVGVRWRSPVGPIRADLAHPLDSNQTIRFHLRIGPDL